MSTEAKLEKLPTLEQYRAMVNPAKEICRWCGVQLPMAVLHYPHSDGWSVDGINGPQWLYLRCVSCDYDWSLWKLGVSR